MKVLVLLSGGLDSLACVAHYRATGAEVSALFVEYGQRAQQQERRAVRRISDAISLDVDSVAIHGLASRGGVIPARNALLLSTALMYSGGDTGIIAIGIHAGTGYADCTPMFVTQMQGVFDTYTAGGAMVGAPFLDWRKHQVWEFLDLAGYPKDLTYSCERGGVQPCGTCLSCYDLRALNAR